MKLYLISDKVLSPYNILPDLLCKAIDNGCNIFQFRDKDSNDNEIASLCVELETICKERNVTFILNDRVELALKLGVGGIHIGKDDMSMPFSEIRESFNGIIGVSCYGDIDRAIRYENLGANYVAFGSVFNSPTKKDSAVVGIEVINRAKSKLKCDICAIGGINRHNIATLKNADLIALISSAWIGDVGENLRAMRLAFNDKH